MRACIHVDMHSHLYISVTHTHMSTYITHLYSVVQPMITGICCLTAGLAIGQSSRHNARGTLSKSPPEHCVVLICPDSARAKNTDKYFHNRLGVLSHSYQYHHQAINNCN